MAIFGDFLGPAFPSSRVQHISDLRSKLALGPDHVWKCGTYNVRRLRLGEEKKRKKKKERTRMWANAQRDGRFAEHRWRPLFNAAKFG